MFRNLLKRHPSPTIPMPTTRYSLEMIASLLGCDTYTIVDDELNLETSPVKDSGIIGGIKVRLTIAPPSLTTVAEPRTARATYTYTTKSSGVQREFTMWDVTYYPLSATTSEGDENAARAVYSELSRIIFEHELD